ncbi:MAG: M48 family metallopeptidase [Bacteroidia bacterium]|nr:M48 family metallopeptidase [Bacteroidia bacterium]
MKKTLIVGAVLSLCTSFAQQNLKTGYTPLKSKGTLPEVFTQNIRNVIKEDITMMEKNKESDRKVKSAFVTASNYEIERIVKSGNALINDEVTKYINEVVDVILKDNQTLRKEIKVFALKSSVVNAHSYDKGFIFINIGLLAQLESEAQLAYILCHEITHYTKRHQINGYVEYEKIDRMRYNGGDGEEKVIEKCQYSKEQESEADIEGFRLFERSAYNLKQAEKAFDVLQYAHLPFDLIEFKKSFLETPGFTLPSGYFLKEVSSIKDNSNEDDTKMTHPNTKKRKQAVADLVSNRDNSKRVNAIVSQERFEYIRDVARMELCRLYLKDRDYPNAWYAAYMLQQKFPENEYLAEIIAKCLYSISLYKKDEISYGSDSHLENGIPAYEKIESYPQQIYHLISKMPENEWAIVSLNYIYRAHKKFSDNKTLTVLSDSMFSLMKRTNWGVSEFPKVYKKEQTASTDSTIKEKQEPAQPEASSKTERIASLQKERISRVDDTVYYKNIFVDLFMKDTEFSSKFPASGKQTEQVAEGFSVYRSRKSSSSSSSSSEKKTKKDKDEENRKQEVKVEKVLLLEPFFFVVKEGSREGIKYLSSDQKQEKYASLISEDAKKIGLELITIDPHVLTANEVDKMNDYSIMNDWFDEKFDGDKENSMILNTNEMGQLISKYGTQYVLKTGIISVTARNGKQRTFIYAFLYDVKANELIYRKYEYFKTRDMQDMINAKAYQILFDLKHPIKKMKS